MEDMEDTVSCRNKEAHALAKRTLKMIRGDKQEKMYVSRQFDQGRSYNFAACAELKDL